MAAIVVFLLANASRGGYRADRGFNRFSGV
jgi:hypothetical protein